MFVPLFLSGGAMGKAFAQIDVGSTRGDLFAAVGMASFIAAGYKTPLAAVVFVAETSGSHSYIIPTLIGAAIAYAVSGEASVSGDQRLHQAARVSGLGGIKVADVMQRRVVGVQASSTLREFADSVAAHHRYTIFPVYDGARTVGTMPVWASSKVPVERWEQTRVGDIADPNMKRITGIPTSTRPCACSHARPRRRFCWLPRRRTRAPIHSKENWRESSPRAISCARWATASKVAARMRRATAPARPERAARLLAARARHPLLRAVYVDILKRVRHEARGVDRHEAPRFGMDVALEEVAPRTLTTSISPSGS